MTKRGTLDRRRLRITSINYNANEFPKTSKTRTLRRPLGTVGRLGVPLSFSSDEEDSLEALGKYSLRVRRPRSGCDFKTLTFALERDFNFVCVKHLPIRRLYSYLFRRNTTVFCDIDTKHKCLITTTLHK